MSQTNSKQDFKAKITTYFKGVKNEWSKVSWPTKKQVVAETIIVLIVVTLFTIAIFLTDKLFIWLLNLIKNIAQ